MYCPSCGQQQSAGARFCSSCGSAQATLSGPTRAGATLTGGRTLGGARSSTAGEQLRGRVLRGFRIERKLGQGGMGAVYLATQVKLGREVALKILPPLLAADGGLIARFEREARALAAVESSHIIPIHDLFEADGLFCIAMGYAAGGSLAERLRRGPVAEAEAAELIRQAALGLFDAHRGAGLVHRDIKPDNLLLSASGRVLIADFGLARAAQGSTGLTRSGSLLGTPAFMAPEQFQNVRAVDHRSDLYALGCTLWTLLLGRPPFRGPSPAAFMHQHIVEPPPDPRSLRPALSPALCAVLARLLAKAPDARFPDGAALAAALAPLCASAPSGAPRGVPPAGEAAVARREEAPVRGAAAREEPPAQSTPSARAPSGERTDAVRAQDEALAAPDAPRGAGRWLALAVLALAVGGLGWFLWPGVGEARLDGLEPADGSLLRAPVSSLRGRLRGAPLPDSVEVDGRRVPVVGGSFAAPIALVEGRNTVRLRVLGETLTWSATLDTTPPALRLLAPHGPVVAGRRPAVEVACTAPDLASLAIDGVEQNLGAERYSARVRRPDGPTLVLVRARDRAGNESSLEVRFRVDATPPVPEVEVAYDGGQVLLRVRAAEPLARIAAAGARLLPDGRLALRPAERAGELLVEVEDEAGNPGSRLVRYALPEAQPGLVAASWWWTPDRQFEEAERRGLPVAVQNSLGMRLALIPPGRFTMGSPADEAYHMVDEQTREVALTVPFYLAACEVTSAQWGRLMGTPDGGEEPASDCTWYDALAFCNALSEAEGLAPVYRLSAVERDASGAIVAAEVAWLGPRRDGYRLPTEAEWEYACRAGSGAMTWAGDFDEEDHAERLERVAWYFGNTEEKRPVGRTRPNPWGLYDTHGNVWEWCWDVYSAPIGVPPPAADPLGPLQGAFRCARGGGYQALAEQLRAANRAREEPGARFPWVGLRVARSVPPEPELSSLQTAAAELLGLPALERGPSGVDLALVPAGSFIRGSAERAGAGPPHEVVLGRPFLLALTELTQLQWHHALGGAPSRFPAAGASAPVESVTWYDALALCNALSEQAGLPPFYILDEVVRDEAGNITSARVRRESLDSPGYRLPTEAEWEYACRGCEQEPWSAVSASAKSLAGVAWHTGNADVAWEGWSGAELTPPRPLASLGPHPVGSLAASPWGFHDLLGNIFEWTWDAQGSYPTARQRDPTGPWDASQRTVRGGSFFSPPQDVLGLERYYAGPDRAMGSVGLRVARTLAPAPPLPTMPEQELAARARQVPVEARNSLGMVLRLVPPGNFTLGSPVGELGRYDDETQTEVRLTRALYVAATEVTQRQWHALRGALPSSFEVAGEEAPVEGMSWYDALDFCNALSEAEGLEPCYRLEDVERANGSIHAATVRFLGLERSGYRLPTEAEWEYSCRAGTRGPLYQGSWDARGQNDVPALDALGVYAGNSGVSWQGDEAADWPERAEDFLCGGIHPVAGKRPNPWGLYDMLGNVVEWCWDGYGPYAPGPLVDPLGPEAARRVLRGGSYRHYASSCRAAARGADEPGEGYRNAGFRVVRTIP